MKEYFSSTNLTGESNFIFPGRDDCSSVSEELYLLNVMDRMVRPARAARRFPHWPFFPTRPRSRSSRAQAACPPPNLHLQNDLPGHVETARAKTSTYLHGCARVGMSDLVVCRRIMESVVRKARSICVSAAETSRGEVERPYFKHMLLLTELSTEEMWRWPK